MKFRLKFNALLLMLCLLAALPVYSQSPFRRDEPAPGTSKPTPRLANGKPDLNGYWVGSNQTKPVGNIGKDLPGFKLPLTPAGEAALKYNHTQSIDPESRCLPGGIPRHSASGLPFSILQTDNRVAFLYFYNYFRVVPVDGRKHTEDPDPTFFGEEIGSWDGDTFVVDAIGFKDENMWIDENANPVSGQVHVVERWTRLDADRLYLETTITDPKYYTKPFKYTRTFLSGPSDALLKEYACSENEVGRDGLGFGPGPIRPDGSRGYIDAAPLPPPPTPQNPARTSK